MNKSRIEAFTDGVMAIIITIMVLELTPPEVGVEGSIVEFMSSIGLYAISFVYVGIYWMNHHHLMQTVTKITGKILLANLGLLFSLSLIPIATSFVGEYFDSPALIFYGIILMLSSIVYAILVKMIIDSDNQLTKSIYDKHGNMKERISTILYIAGIIVSLISPAISLIVYIAVGIMWLIPDTRIEKQIEEKCK